MEFGWMDGSTDQYARSASFFFTTNKDGNHARSGLAGLGWWRREEVGLGLHDINLAWVFVGVKHKRQLCC